MLDFATAWPCRPILLVFSKCFHAGFGSYSTFKYRVKEGTNMCNFWSVHYIWPGRGEGVVFDCSLGGGEDFFF